MPSEAEIAGIRKNVEAFEAVRASAVRQARWRMPLFVGLVLGVMVLVAWLFNRVADPNEQWVSTPHVFLYVVGFVVAILLYFQAMKPVTRLRQSYRQTLVSIIFGFIRDMRYQHGVTPNSFDRLPHETVAGFTKSRFDDILSGRYEGFPFELYEAELSDGTTITKRVTTFKGVIVAFETIEPFPGILVVAPRANPVVRLFRGMFAKKMQELSSGIPELDTAYRFSTDNAEAAQSLITGRLAQALKWLGETWPGEPARVALNGSDGFLLLPQTKDFLNLPDISMPLDYTRHVAPMISDIGALLATAALVRKIGAKDE